jgi:rSAM/selenodomain-associated transferase 1
MSVTSIRFAHSRLLIFAKAPIVGQVKTRLIPAIGATAACDFYRQCLHTTVARMVHASIAPITVYATDIYHPEIQVLTQHYPLRLCQQHGVDLGERMAQALTASLGGDVQSAILIGTDTPGLTPDDVAQGFHQLKSGTDVVMTPTEDGGYALIGMRQIQPALFQAIPWSTARVADLTRQACRAQKLRLYELPTRWDIDCAADLARYYQ